MPYYSFNSAFGFLTAFEEDDRLVALEWGRAAGGEKQKPSALLRETQKQIEAYGAGKLTRFDLPLAPRGTPFMQRVWRHMRAIPYGEVETYGAVAAKIGSAPRAVGGACGRNPIPIIVPCHRIVGAGGRLTGYTGAAGVETKRALLRLEGAHLNPLFTRPALAA